MRTARGWTAGGVGMTGIIHELHLLATTQTITIIDPKQQAVHPYAQVRGNDDDME